jgi:thiamine biosynthesis lipoprotein
LVHAITLPPGVHLDLGGIGKGLAADFVARALVHDGAAGACINLGGDLCAFGTPSDNTGWIVELTLPAPDALGGRNHIAIPHGAVATSSTQIHRWSGPNGEAHHLIDPHTGQPATSDIQIATVLAMDAWWAETCAKTLIITGTIALAEQHGNAGLIVWTDGSVQTFGGFEQYLISTDSHPNNPVS